MRNPCFSEECKIVFRFTLHLGHYKNRTTLTRASASTTAVSYTLIGQDEIKEWLISSSLSINEGPVAMKGKAEPMNVYYLNRASESTDDWMNVSLIHVSPRKKKPFLSVTFLCSSPPFVPSLLPTPSFLFCLFQYVFIKGTSAVNIKKNGEKIRTVKGSRLGWKQPQPRLALLFSSWTPADESNVVSVVAARHLTLLLADAPVDTINK